jgi:ribosome-associated protein
MNQVPVREIEFSYARSSGAGGQNVNKVNSKVILKWKIEQSLLPQPLLKRFKEKFSRYINNEGEVVISSQRFREQGRNVADSLQKLHLMLHEASQIPKTRLKTKPTRAAQKERLQSKTHRSDLKKARQKIRHSKHHDD